MSTVPGFLRGETCPSCSIRGLSSSFLRTFKLLGQGYRRFSWGCSGFVQILMERALEYFIQGTVRAAHDPILPWQSVRQLGLWCQVDSDHGPYVHVITRASCTSPRFQA